MILAAIVGVGFAAWPFYRKFFINQWLERMVRGQPIVFEPDCPDLHDHFKCNDRYTIVFSRNEKNQWCQHVRKNDEPADSVICDTDSAAPAQTGKWRRLNIDGRDLQFSWRGRVVVPVVGYPIGWFTTPERAARMIASPSSWNDEN
jgi:hypothetical protein